MPRLICCSHKEFNDIMEKNGWSDSNIPSDCAFISIIGTPECQKYYLKEDAPHWFKSEASGQVCNLEFDDIARDEFTWNGITFYGLSMEQAEKIVKFIDKNLGKNFYIHCRAGKSRSQGIVRYILDIYPDMYDSSDCREDNPCLTPNMDVVIKLKRSMWNEVLSQEKDR